MFNKSVSDSLQRTWLAAGAAVVTVGAGIYKDVKANKAQKNAAGRRTAYTRPKELIDIVNANQAMATQGLPEETLAYMTNQNDRAFNSSLGALQRLGGDANSAAALFEQNLQNTFKIGSQNALVNMQNWDKFINSKQYLAQASDAEWASREGMVKDEQAAAQQRRLEANAQITSGINAGISAYGNYQTGQLYKPQTTQVDAGSNRYIPNANPETVSSTDVRTAGSTITRTVVGFDPVTGRPIYG